MSEAVTSSWLRKTLPFVLSAKSLVMKYVVKVMIRRDTVMSKELLLTANR